MRLAAVDIGSNSVHLIIADTFGPHSFQVIDRERERVKLGAGAFKTGRLMPGPSQAALEALKRCATLCKRHKVKRVLAVATSAVREAANGREFLQLVKRQTGIDARLIDGIEEARLIYRGIRHATDLEGRKALMLDLGGGSLEVMYGNARRLIVSKSLPLGVQRLRDMFNHEDPLSRRSRTRLLKLIETTLGPVLKDIRRRGIDCVVGTSGTHMSLGLACLRLRGRDPWGSLNGYEIHTSELVDLAGELLSVNTAGRTRLPAIDERRGDVIHFGAAVLTTALRLVKADTFQLCGSSLREGMLLAELERIHKYKGDPPNVRLTSALELIRHTGADPKRALHHAELALAIYDGTRRLHRLDPRCRDLLETAALLDGIGRGMNYLDREHITYQLIRGGGLRGLTNNEMEIVGLTARYSRRGSPKERHRHFSELDPDSQHVVRMLAGMLRIALGLDRGGRGLVKGVRCRVQDGTLRIYASGSAATELEVAAANGATRLFAQAIDHDIVVSRSAR
ncbi:MAG: Guanosine-5'-triphosphate,3'-diphosphate pyrophosphatase [Planctomycetes bacterium]|nr:Guanosine-5'-triphosphate,3'-diphosphate pyrophosphatase [Planctomycetota bacterium]